MSKLKSTTLRDFSGGWNALDDDLNLAGTYQSVLDNARRGLDNTLSVRPGYELFADMKDGVETADTATFDVVTTNGSREVTVNWTGHGFASGNHITFTSTFSVGGLVASELINKPHGVNVINADQFIIYLRTAATSGATNSVSKDYTKDTHTLAGTLIELNYFSDFIVAVDSRGEIAKVSRAGAKTRIWDASISKALSGTPIGWTECSYVSSDVFQGQLIVVNGQDKPIQIDFTITDEVQYLVDLGTGSNVNTPIAKYVRSVGRWLLMAGDPTTQNRVHVSASDTSGTWYGDPAPNDAVYVDINYASNSPSVTIRGIGKFREFAVVAFDDSLVMLALGTFDTSTPPVHQPNINDIIARHGSVAHKSMVFLGFDLIMADPIGVPSIAKSLYDSSVTPSRQSDVISPPLQRNIGRLSPETLEKDVFAVYNTHDFEYMLFMPDYDDDVLTLDDNPFIVPDSMVGTNQVIVERTNHGFEAGDSFTISGSTDFSGITAATYINTTHTVAAVLNDDYFLIEIGTNSTSASQGGGSAVTLTRNFNETTCYAFTYSKKLKTRTWARYRDMQFNAGCTSVYGRVFLASDNRIWRMGNMFEPIYADFVNNYDSIWAVNTGYVVGDRIYDQVTNETFTCLEAHTSASSGTFAADRASHTEFWEKYYGEDIQFAIETPWADFNERTKTKLLQYFGIDARGRGELTVMLFVDYYYKSKLDGTFTPYKQLDFVGGDTGGFGAGQQNFGSGRIATRQRLWPLTAKGKMFKLRIEGATKEKLRIVAMQFEYMLGSIYR